MSIGFQNGGSRNDADAPAARGRPRDPAKDEAIVEAATHLFLDRGFEAVSVDAIAAAAGVSKATVYARYQDKDALFGEVLRRKCDAMVDPSHLEPSPTRAPREVLTTVAWKFLALITDPQVLAMHRVIANETGRAPRVGELFFERAVQPLKRRFTFWVEAETAAGRLAVTQPERAAWRFFGAVQGESHLRAMLGMEPVRPEVLQDHVTATVDDFVRAWTPGLPVCSDR